MRVIRESVELIIVNRLRIEGSSKEGERGRRPTLVICRLQRGGRGSVAYDTARGYVSMLHHLGVVSDAAPETPRSLAASIKTRNGPERDGAEHERDADVDREADDPDADDERERATVRHWLERRPAELERDDDQQDAE